MTNKLVKRFNSTAVGFAFYVVTLGFILISAILFLPIFFPNAPASNEQYAMYALTLAGNVVFAAAGYMLGRQKNDSQQFRKVKENQ